MTKEFIEYVYQEQLKDKQSRMMTQLLIKAGIPKSDKLKEVVDFAVGTLIGQLVRRLCDELLHQIKMEDTTEAKLNKTIENLNNFIDSTRSW